jgi:hypothetical protein
MRGSGRIASYGKFGGKKSIFIIDDALLRYTAPIRYYLGGLSMSIGTGAAYRLKPGGTLVDGCEVTAWTAPHGRRRTWKGMGRRSRSLRIVQRLPSFGLEPT